MGLLVERLEDVHDRLARSPEDPELRAGVESALALAAGHDRYVAGCTSEESPALAALTEQTVATDWTSTGGADLEAEMLSGHVEGRLLAMLVYATGARRVLEIGMFTGYSALAMAEALPADGEVVACELDPEAARIARECFDRSPAGDRIDVRVGPAADTLAALAEQGDAFDFVFLDAEKAGYLGYVETLLDRGLLTPRAVVAVDNTLMQGEPYLADRTSAAGEAIARFNAAVAADPRVEQVLVPIRDGLTLIRQVDAG